MGWGGVGWGGGDDGEGTVKGYGNPSLALLLVFKTPADGRLIDFFIGGCWGQRSAVSGTWESYKHQHLLPTFWPLACSGSWAPPVCRDF